MKAICVDLSDCPAVYQSEKHVFCSLHFHPPVKMPTLNKEMSPIPKSSAESLAAVLKHFTCMY